MVEAEFRVGGELTASKHLVIVSYSLVSWWRGEMYFDGAGPRSIRYLTVGINTQLRKKLNSTSNRFAQLPI